MTRFLRIEPDPVALLEEFRAYLDDPNHVEDRAMLLRTYEQFVGAFDEYAQVFTEMAAWCRLGVAVLRGEDVPLSIHVPKGEDPADTARWRKWRLS
jgi:hypothetical protein